LKKTKVCLKNAVAFENERFWVLSKRLFEGNPEASELSSKKRAAQVQKDSF
jgi:hypothetical protein